MEEKRKQKEKKVITLDNIEVVRGAVGFNRGVHRWEFIWKHDPYWSGKGDAVGICTRDSGTLGPQAFPCIGEDQYSWGIHCDGSVVHKGDVIGAVSELEKKHILKSSSSKEKKDINVVWCKDCVVTCVLDCEQHTFSIEINGKLVKDAVVKNLPSGVKFFPLISTCPAPAEEEDENDDEEMDNNDAEILELKEKKTDSSFPLISIVREKKREKDVSKEEEKEEEEIVEKKPLTPPKEIFGWQWKRTDKTRWTFFEEEVEINIEKEYKKHASAWHYVYNWDHKGWSELAEGEKEWRLSINHSNPQQGNVYKSGHGFYYLIRRLNSGYEPSRDGEARWMYESERGWEVYNQTKSDEIEDAWQNEKKSVTIVENERTVHVDLKHLQQFQEGADNSKAERVRRQQLSQGYKSYVASTHSDVLTSVLASWCERD